MDIETRARLAGLHLTSEDVQQFFPMTPEKIDLLQALHKWLEENPEAGSEDIAAWAEKRMTGH